MGENPQNSSDVSYANAMRPKVLERFAYYLDLRDEFNPYEIPQLETVTGALRMVFAEDTGLMAFPLPRENKGVYQVTLTTPLTHLEEHPIKFARKNELSGDDEIVDLFLKTPDQAPIRTKGRDGLLVTIAQGAVGGAASIPNDLFDEAFKKFGEITVPTKLQN